jgi:hypothetical protein
MRVVCEMPVMAVAMGAMCVAAMMTPVMTAVCVAVTAMSVSPVPAAASECGRHIHQHQANDRH